MNNLPCELINEIYKFTINKKEINTMILLTSNIFNTLNIYEQNRFGYAYIAKSIKLLKWYKENGFEWTYSVLHYTTLSCKLDNIKWLKKNGCVIDRISLKAVMESGKNIKWFMKQFPLNEYAFYGAAINGDLKKMKWLKKKYCPMDVMAYWGVAINGCIKNIKWLEKNNCPLVQRINPQRNIYKMPLIYEFATKHNNLKIIKWLHKRNINNDVVEKSRIFNHAIQCGNLKIIKWFEKKNFTNEKNLFTFRIKINSLETLMWLKKNNYTMCDPAPNPSDDNIKKVRMREIFVTGTNISGNYEIIKWCIKNNYNVNFANAIEYGSVKSMKFLKKNGTQWNDYTFSYAVKHMKFRIIKWLHNNGCPWNSDTFNIAISGGNLTIIKWLKEKGCPIDNLEVLKIANKISVFRWLKENSYTFNSNVFNDAIKRKNLKLMKWLKENGSYYNYNSMIEAIKTCSLPIIRWLKENKCPFDKHHWNEWKKINKIRLNFFYTTEDDDSIIEWLKEINCPINISKLCDNNIHAVNELIQHCNKKIVF